MSREMLINVSEGEECRIALVENGRLEEIYMERASATSHVGNIYKGRVTNVEPAIQAAFVDFGLGRNGFLHISDLLPTYFGKRGEDMAESVGRKLSRRDRPPIQRCLRRGDEITVQIIKEGIGTKGPTLSTYLSIPGRILVMMPGMENFGVSRKIEDEKERRRLRKILDELDPIEGVGFIIRTAGMGKTKADIEKDLKYLTRLWETISKISTTTKAPVELYTEGDLVTRTVRDVYGTDIDRIVIDSKEVGRRVKDFVKLTAPRGKTKVELHKDPIPLFHAYGIEREIEMIHSRHVPLPSGGSLVIDSTEAVVAIDVNSGKFREHSDAETTAFKTDMEAADEIPRQLKLRDLGGVIICDFIDLRFERHRRQLEQRLFDNFKTDKAKTRVLRMSEFGIIEITRQRMRASLKRSIYSDCPHCRGHGLVKTPESMALDVMRKLAIAVADERVVRVELGVCAEVAFFLGNRRRRQLAKLEEETGKTVEVKALEGVGLDELKLDLFDLRDSRVLVDALGMVPESGDRHHRHRRDSGGGSGGGRGARPDHRQPHRGQSDAARSQDVDDAEEQDDSGAPESQRDDRPRRTDRGRGERSQGRGDARPAAGAQPADNRRERPEDRIRPLGMEPLREGAGHRGPRVVQPDEFDLEVPAADAGQDLSDGEGYDDTDTTGSGELGGVGGSGDAGGGQGPDGGDGTGRRRRRRRRGGRGRRRNRGTEDASGATEGPFVSETGDETANAESGDQEMEDLSERVSDADRFDDSDTDIGRARERDSFDPSADDSVGEAPTAIGDEPELALDLGIAEPDESEDAAAELTEPVDELADPLPKKGRGRSGRSGGRGRRGRNQPDEAVEPVAETAEASDAVPTAEPDAPAEEAGETAGEVGPSGRSGRSRRRGGRGRGRGDKPEPQADVGSRLPAARAEVAVKRVPPSAPVREQRPAPNSGGRTSGGRLPAAPTPARRMPTPVNIPGPLRSPTPVSVPPPLPGVGRKAPTADKHLADDEPVDPQPLRRPKSYGDLDAIPDDLD